MTEPREPHVRVLKVGALAVVVLLVVAVPLGALRAGSEGAVAALVGALVPAVFLGITALTAVRARRLRADLLGFAILASWVPKLLALVVFLAWMRHGHWYDRPTLFVTLLAGTVVLLGVEGWLVTRAPQFYAETPRT